MPERAAGPRAQGPGPEGPGPKGPWEDKGRTGPDGAAGQLNYQLH